MGVEQGGNKMGSLNCPFLENVFQNVFRVLGNFLNTLFPFPGTTLFATRRRGRWEGRENRNSGRDLSSTAQGVIKSRLCFRLRPRIAFRLSGKKPHNAGNYCERSFFFFLSEIIFPIRARFFS